MNKAEGRENEIDSSRKKGPSFLVAIFVKRCSVKGSLRAEHVPPTTSTTMSMTSPLQLYEVVKRVRDFITVWKAREDHWYWHFDFQPKDLISCMQVSEAWNQVLTPLLWRVYNDEDINRLGQRIR